MSYGIFITLNSKTKCMIQSFNFIVSCSALPSLNGALIWLVLIKTLFLIQSLCILWWGHSEEAKYVCLQTFLAICFTHVQLVFTTRFEMLSVFIAGQEVVVSSGEAPTPAGTSMFTIWKICAHMKCEVKHNGDMGMGHLWLKWVGQLWQSITNEQMCNKQHNLACSS